MITYLVDAKWGDGPKFNEYTGDDPDTAETVAQNCAAEGAHVVMRQVGPAPGQFETIYDSEDVVE